MVGDNIGPPDTDVLKQMATNLSVPNEAYLQTWSDTSYERNTGAFRSVKDNILYICKELPAQPSGNDINLAARFRHNYATKVMTRPRSGAFGTLSKFDLLPEK